MKKVKKNLKGLILVKLCEMVRVRYLSATKVATPCAPEHKEEQIKEIDGIDSFFRQIKDNGLNPSKLKKAWYGMREFYLKDNNGYILGFSQKSE